MEELLKKEADKRAILNIPVSFDDNKSKGGHLDEEFMLDALEKLRDYI